MHGRMRLHGELPCPFKTTKGVRQGCPISSFLFNFVIGKIIENPLRGLQEVGVKLANEEHRYDVNYADDIVCMHKCTKHAQRVLDRITKAATSFGICFASLKSKVLLQDWT